MSVEDSTAISAHAKKKSLPSIPEGCEVESTVEATEGTPLRDSTSTATTIRETRTQDAGGVAGDQTTLMLQIAGFQG